MSKKDNYTISAVILGLSAFVFLLGFGGAVYGLLSTGNGKLMAVAIIFGLIGFSCLGATFHAAHRALHA